MSGPQDEGDLVIEPAHGEVESTGLLSPNWLSTGKARSNSKGMGPNIGDIDFQAGPDRDPQVVELVVRRDGAEVGEEDLVEGIRGVPGKLVSTEPTAIMMPPVGTSKTCGLTVRYWKPRRLPKLPAKNRS